MSCPQPARPVLGVGLALRDFLKVIPVVGLNQAAASKLAALGACMAREEGLEAHARALDRRAKG